MTWPLRQSTAGQEIPLGPFLDSVDGNTQETALTIANTDIKLFKSGATSEVSKNSGGATHMANGRFYTVLDATDSNTLGPMRVSSHFTGALAVWLDCCVYPANVFDALFLGTDKLDVNPTELNGDATAAANLAHTTRATVRCTASGVPTTTSIPTSACTPAGAAADQFKGMIIKFDADTTTTALRGQSTEITASTNSATPTFTVVALTTAAVAGDKFSAQ